MSQITPFRATSHRFEASGGPLALVIAEPEIDTGQPPVLLIPGYTGSKEDFAPLFDPLSEAGYRVISLDLQGQNESLGPDDPAAYTMDALGRDVLDVIKDLGGAAHVVGHSMGGLVARAAAIASPEAFISLALLCSGPSAINTGARKARMEAVAPLLDSGGLEAVYDALEQMDGNRGLSPELQAFLRKRFVASSPIGLQVMGNAVATGEPDRVDKLRETGLPILVTYGETDDAWTPAIQNAMAARLGIEPVVISGAGHSPAIENPDETVQVLLRFWAELR